MKIKAPFVFFNAVAVLPAAQVSWTDLHVWSRAATDNWSNSIKPPAANDSAPDMMPQLLLAFPPGAARTHVTDDDGKVFVFHSQVNLDPDSFLIFGNYSFSEAGVGTNVNLPNGAAFMVSAPLKGTVLGLYGQPGGFVLTVPLHLYPKLDLLLCCPDTTASAA